MIRGIAAVLGSTLALCVAPGALASKDGSNPGFDSADSSNNDAFAQQIPVRGIVRSAQQSSISSELTARVDQIAFREGEQFFKGDLLIRLDCRRLIAEWESAEAFKREMDLALKSATYLLDQRIGSKHKVDTAKARVDRAKAELRAMASRVDQCEIRAPYDGLVANVTVREHEMSNTGKPLVSIVSFNNPRLELIVPSNWLTWLKRDMDFDFSVDETQTTHRATVKRVSATVDSVSQTVKIYAQFKTNPMDILPGMSGTAKFK